MSDAPVFLASGDVLWIADARHARVEMALPAAFVPTLDEIASPPVSVPRVFCRRGQVRWNGGWRGYYVQDGHEVKLGAVVREMLERVDMRESAEGGER